MCKNYIVILNYNGYKDTIALLESIIKFETIDYRIVVVDNCSNDNSLDYLIKWACDNKKSYLLFNADKIEHKKINTKLVFIASDFNGGFAAGVNIGLKFALSDKLMNYVWVLNNDTVLYKKDTLKSLLTCFERKKREIKIGMIGNIQYFYHDPNTIQAVGGGFDKLRGSFWNITDRNIANDHISYVYGASMLFSREVLENVGLLNEEYFLYYEEIDYALRLKKRGYALFVSKNISILHKHSNTISKESNSFRKYYLERNKIVFYKNFFPYLIFIPYLKIFKSMIRNFIKEKKVDRIYFDILRGDVPK
jgi:GT2 family glycosyltransferase